MKNFLKNKIPAWIIPGVKKDYTSKAIITNIENIVGFSIIVKTRKREIVEARQIAMYIIKHHTSLSLARIGQDCGNKDHATVLHACKTVSNLMETDKNYIKKYQKIFEFYRIDVNIH